MLKPITPQCSRRVEWECDVAFQLATLLDCCNSDAQGLMEVQAETVTRSWLAGATPEQCAAAVDRASLQPDPGMQPKQPPACFVPPIAKPGDLSFTPHTITDHRAHEAALNAKAEQRERAHTPTPWRYYDGRILGFEDGEQITIAYATDGDAALTEYDEPNMRRVVACVNACEGVSTGSLEAVPVKLVKQALSEVLRRNRALQADLDGTVRLLAVERGAHSKTADHAVNHLSHAANLFASASELLGALKALTSTFLDGTHYETRNPYTRPECVRALKAIAKATGQPEHQWMQAMNDGAANACQSKGSAS